jgi:hypothetical protein
MLGSRRDRAGDLLRELSLPKMWNQIFDKYARARLSENYSQWCPN